MSSSKRKFMDVLGDGSDNGDSSDDSDSEAPSKKKVAVPGVSKAPQTLKLEDLEKAGYQSGPSVLHIPAQAVVEPECNWGWSDGAAAKAKETEETIQDRAATRHAVTTAVEENAFYTHKMISYADKLRVEKKAEKDAKAKQKSLSFKEKEKKKRDAGQQSAGKNYVEEEKRIAREAGVYSGFDT